jgi:hypothetical protein
LIVATIAGQQVDRAAVQAWEDHRARVVMRKLGIPDNAAMTLPERRAALLAHKLAQGHDGLRHRLRFQLFLSHLVAIVLALLSGKRRSFSVCELWVERGSAQHFQRWFEDRVPLDDQAGMLAGCPDHYIIATSATNHQRVVETCGGAPFASEVVIDYADQSSVLTPPDPSYPLQIAGVASLASGRAVGGVRHQFRQEGEGFRARVTVEFPSTIFGSIIAGQRWHLATEFSNWIEAAGAAAD